MSSTQFNRGPTYGLSAEVKSKIAQKYDPQREEELRLWIEDVTGCTIGEDFQKGLKNGIILCKLINKLQPGSVKKISQSSQNWHQLENLSNFIKAITTYGLKPHDIFEANDLFECGNMTQVQTTLLALAGMAKTKGIQSSVDIGVKYADRQERAFDEEKLKAGQCVIGLQMGTNKCASQAGMHAYGTRRHLYDPKAHIQPPMDNCTISLQMGTNKGASQSGMTAPGTRRAIYDHKLGTDKCDNSTMSLQMGYAQGANQSGQSFGMGRQIYDAKYCPKSEGEEEHNGVGSSSHAQEYQDEAYQGEGKQECRDKGLQENQDDDNQEDQNDGNQENEDDVNQENEDDGNQENQNDGNLEGQDQDSNEEDQDDENQDDQKVEEEEETQEEENEENQEKEPQETEEVAEDD